MSDGAIVNVRIHTGTDTVGEGVVVFEDGRISRVERGRPALGAGLAISDGGHARLFPGLIDLQLNGALGHDFSAVPGSVWSVAETLPRHGVTSFLPTIVSAPLERYGEALAVLSAGPPTGFSGATPMGWHFEGPFLNPEARGAHDARFLRIPDTESVRGWTVDRGTRLVTLAPELAGADALISTLRLAGVKVAAGHSRTDHAGALKAFNDGVGYATHLFNAMPPLHHRRPGLVTAALRHPGVVCGLICDGIHVDPTVVDLVWRLVGRDRFNLVTDAMAALDMPHGTYRLGDQDVTVDRGGARLEDGTLAGSVLTLDAAVRNLVAWTGCTLADAVHTATAVPADLLGERRGRLAPGNAADFVLMHDDGNVLETWVGGRRVFRAET